ncbi:MAG TPA: hypothetical protein PLL64_00905 [Rhodothermales bacterium]|nr:hypothetical protein [Bacteroidota bacterium]HRK72804.1 hypothetical protein [Rhodothermales bacterium]HRR09001.1 hypothetical protein [Rhodothermales bacterium]
MEVYYLIGAAAAFIAMSSVIGGMFSKYIEVRRYKPEKELELAREALKDAQNTIITLKEGNADLRRRIEKLEARVTSAPLMHQSEEMHETRSIGKSRVNE